MIVMGESIDMELEFKRGETIHTENSRKFTKKSIEDMAARAGLSIRNWYSDHDGWFSLVVMGLNPPSCGNITDTTPIPTLTTR